MSFEPWMLRTGVVILAVNCVNALLFWVAHRRNHPSHGRRLEAPDMTPFGQLTREVPVIDPQRKAGSWLTTAFAGASKARTPQLPTAGPSARARSAAGVTE
jgi:hypothetical protein